MLARSLALVVVCCVAACGGDDDQGHDAATTATTDVDATDVADAIDADGVADATETIEPDERADDGDVLPGAAPTATLSLPPEVVAGSTFSVVLELADVDQDLAHVTLRTTDALGVHEVELSLTTLGLDAAGGRYQATRAADVLVVGASTVEVTPVDLAGHVGAPASAVITLVPAATGAPPSLTTWAPRVASWQRPTGARDRLTPRFELAGSDADEDITRLRVRVTDPLGVATVTELPLLQIGDVRPVTLDADAPLGVWSVAARLVDAAGHLSDERTATLTLADDGAAAPTITGVTPATIEAGEALTISGRGLGDPDRVVVAGVDMTTSSQSDTTLVGPFPDGAGSGVVRVEVPDGVAFAAEPTVVPPRLVLAAPPIVVAGGEAGLSVRVVSSVTSAIDWEVSAGTLTPGADSRDATLTAPTNAGSVDIVARLASDAAVVASTTIEVLAPAGAADRVGALGGSLELAEGRVTLDVPPGALASTVAITAAWVAPSDVAAPAGRRPLGAVELGPDGTTFTKPVTLRIMLSARRPPGRVLALREVLPGGRFGPAAAAVVVDDGRFAEATVSHFSTHAVDEDTPVCAGDPPIVTRVEPAELLEGQTTPLRLIGHNLAPEVRAEVLLPVAQAGDIGLFPWYGQYQQAAIGVIVSTIPGFADRTQTYTLRLTDTCERGVDVPFVVRGLPELTTTGVTRWTGADEPARQLYSEITLDGLVEVGPVPRFLAATGAVRLRGTLLASGPKGGDADGDDHGVGVFTGGHGGDGRDTEDDDPPPPFVPPPPPHELGHGQAGAFCFREPVLGQTQCAFGPDSPRGGEPGVDNTLVSDIVSLVTSVIDTVLNAVACVGTLGLACVSLVVSITHLVKDVAAVVVSVSDNSEMLANHGEGGQGASRRGYGGAGGGGGGYRSYVIASSDGGGGGAGGQAGRELQIAAGGNIDLDGAVLLRGGDGGAGAEDGSSGAGGGGGAGGYLDLRSRLAVRLDDGARIDIGAGRGGPSGKIIEEVEIDGEDRDVEFDIPGKDATEHGQVELSDDSGFVGPGVVVSGGLPFGGVTDATTFAVTVSSADPSPTLHVTQSDVSGSCDTCGPTCASCDLTFAQPARVATVSLSPGFVTWTPPFATSDEIPMVQALTERVLIVGADLDGDGLPDVEEELIGADPAIADEDGDGLDDGTERTLTTLPYDDDSDDDGVDDRDEVLQGTSPVVPDGDLDGWPDGLEPTFATDPRRGDTDGDGVRDACEGFYGFDPTDDTSTPTDIEGAPLYLARDGRLGIWDPTLALVADVGVPGFGLGFGLAFGHDGRLYLALLGSLAEASPMTAASDGIGGFGGIMSVTLANGDPPDVGGARGPLLAVEGTIVAGDFVQSGQLLVVSRATGAATRLGAALADPVLALAWGPAGTLYATLDRAVDVLATLDLTGCDLAAKTCTSGPTATVVGPIDDPGCDGPSCPDRAYGLAWSAAESTLVGSLASPETSVILTIDPATAVATRRAEPGGFITGLAFGRPAGEPVVGCDGLAPDAPCSDGDACTAGDRCVGGVCAPTGPVTCNDGIPCTNEVCDTQRGCVIANIAGDLCLIGGVCYETGESDGVDGCKVCLAAVDRFAMSPKPCADENPCTDDVCTGDGVCGHPHNSAPCDDGAFCTTDDRCAAGACGGQPRSCAQLDSACADGVCDEDANTCRAEPVGGPCCTGPADCVDHDPCTIDACTTATGLCSNTAYDCDDDEPCTTDTCNGTGGCSHADRPDLEVCDDGDRCTFDDVCTGGVCGGDLLPGPDFDGDEHDSVCAGGDDCDDSDPDVHPGAIDQIQGIAVASEWIAVSTNALLGARMVVDSRGDRHAVFYEETSKTLGYATDRHDVLPPPPIPGYPVFSGTPARTWTLALLDASSADVGKHPRIAVDALDNLHVAYRDATNAALRYATSTSGTWTRATVTNGVAAVLGIGDDAGTPRIVYRDTGGAARVIAATGDTPALVGTDAELGVPFDAVIDGSGAIHLAGIRSTGPVRYGRFAGGALVAEDVATTPDRTWALVRLTPDGRPVIAWPGTVGAYDQLHVAVRDGGAWTSGVAFQSTIATSAFVPDTWDLAVSDTGYVVCGGWSDGTAKVMRLTGSLAAPGASMTHFGLAGRGCALAHHDGVDLQVSASVLATFTTISAFRTSDATPGVEAVSDNFSVAIATDTAGVLHLAHAGQEGVIVSARHAQGASDMLVEAYDGSWSGNLEDPPPPLPPRDVALAFVAPDRWFVAWHFDGQILVAQGDPSGFDPPDVIGVGEGPALAVRGGEPIAAWVDDDGSPWVATYDGVGWAEQLVSAGSHTGVELAVGPDDVCHLLLRTVDGALVYTYGAPGAFNAVQPITSSAGATFGVAVDAAGDPHVLYFDAALFDVRYRHSPSGGGSGTWVDEKMRDTLNTTASLALALDESGTPWAAWWDPRTFKLAKRSASAGTATWDVVFDSLTPASAPDASRDGSLMVEGGEWHVATADTDVGVARWSSALPGWSEELRFAPRRASSPPIMARAAVAADGSAHALWGSGQLASRRAGLWLESGDFSGLPGLLPGNDLALDAAGRPWIVGALQLFSPGLAIEMVLNDMGRVVGLFDTAAPHQVVGPVAGIVGASVTDMFSFAPTTGALRDTTATTGATPVDVTIDTVGVPSTPTDPNQWAIDAIAAPDGRLHIAYYAPSSADLRYATRPASGAWTTETVATTGDVGLHATVARRADGTLRIAYYDKTNGDLVVADRDTGAWRNTVVDGATARVGTWSRIVALGQDLLIAYRNEDTKALELLVDWGAGWQRFTVEGGDVGHELGFAATDDLALAVHKLAVSNRMRATWITIDNDVDDDCDGR